jgi:2-oxo-4-hydroxy-4-carboxy-5-ureidoimidazoline decarboxylase
VQQSGGTGLGGAEVKQTRLVDFNRLDQHLTADLVRPCLAVRRWWTAVVDQRPYPDLESLLEVARDAAFPLTSAELEAALTHHLATRPADWLPQARSTRTGVRAGLPSVRLVYHLACDVEQYERRFGRPFVTASRSTVEIADQLRSRLRNDADAEDRMIANQLRQLALLHLRQIVG